MVGVHSPLSRRRSEQVSQVMMQSGSVCSISSHKHKLVSVRGVIFETPVPDQSVTLFHAGRAVQRVRNGRRVRGGINRRIGVYVLDEQGQTAAMCVPKQRHESVEEPRGGSVG